MTGNRPSTPKELAAFILKHRVNTLGYVNVLSGKTPFATVSSRISQHFKRCQEHSRRPLIGKRPVLEPNHPSGVPRKWRYFLDAPGVPIAKVIPPPPPSCAQGSASARAPSQRPSRPTAAAAALSSSPQPPPPTTPVHTNGHIPDRPNTLGTPAPDTTAGSASNSDRNSDRNSKASNRTGSASSKAAASLGRAKESSAQPVMKRKRSSSVSSSSGSRPPKALKAEAPPTPSIKSVSAAPLSDEDMLIDIEGIADTAPSSPPGLASGVSHSSASPSASTPLLLPALSSASLSSSSLSASSISSNVSPLSLDKPSSSTLPQSTGIVQDKALAHTDSALFHLALHAELLLRK
ncbi:hypothetical protein BC831DRAFT_473001 [Entophlyctis helioformis]|nr:hypothetical protein BC831DRAFT_473001 [Entophlyctis helioformis]